MEKTVFEDIGLKLDPCLENLLVYHGFDTLETLKLITADVLQYIQDHAQNDMARLIGENEYPRYFGSRYNSVELIAKFQFPLAQRLLLLSTLPPKILEFEKYVLLKP